MNERGIVPVRYLVGVDGGGTGTRVIVSGAAAPGVILARGVAGPSGLGLGIASAWQAIDVALEQAFKTLGVARDWGRCVMGCGLAGVNHAAWHAAFIDSAPEGLAGLCVESDAYTTLLGAHGGAPGAIVALGTGSVGLSLDRRGRRRMSGGFGFPSGDEASGAWLGLRAIAHAQRAVDGRGPCDDFARALLVATGLDFDFDTRCDTSPASGVHGAGGSSVVPAHASRYRDALQSWVIGANQTAYATLAPVVAAHANHPVAHAQLCQAGSDASAMAAAIDPDGDLPLALCGSLAHVIGPYLDAPFIARKVAPQGDAARGALQLAISALSASTRSIDT